MINVKSFTFNAFQENTYLLYGPKGQCFIIDPGCSGRQEEQELDGFIRQNELVPEKLINTHCHIDHVLGNDFVSKTYDLDLCGHKLESSVLDSCEMVSKMYGIPYKASPAITTFLDEGETIELEGCRFDILLTPGHSPGSLCFYNSRDGYVIGGDVLFLQSIGRTDLPGGDFNALIRSIKEKLFHLPDDTVVYPGHGPQTTIGYERINNPFLQGI